MTFSNEKSTTLYVIGVVISVYSQEYPLMSLDITRNRQAVIYRVNRHLFDSIASNLSSHDSQLKVDLSSAKHFWVRM